MLGCDLASMALQSSSAGASEISTSACRAVVVECSTKGLQARDHSSQPVVEVAADLAMVGHGSRKQPVQETQTLAPQTFPAHKAIRCRARQSCKTACSESEEDEEHVSDRFACRDRSLDLARRDGLSISSDPRKRQTPRKSRTPPLRTSASLSL